MPRTFRTLTLLAMVLAVTALWTGTAAATPEQVLADQADNGIIDGASPPDDLRAAIVLAKERAGVQAETAITAIRDAQARELFGTRQTQSPSGAAPSTETDGEPATAQELPPVLRLPEAPVVEPGTTVPVPFVILSVIAAVLMLAGMGASAFRRATRATAEVAGSR